MPRERFEWRVALCFNSVQCRFFPHNSCLTPAFQGGNISSNSNLTQSVSLVLKDQPIVEVVNLSVIFILTAGDLKDTTFGYFFSFSFLVFHLPSVWRLVPSFYSSLKEEKLINDEFIDYRDVNIQLFIKWRTQWTVTWLPSGLSKELRKIFRVSLPFAC